MTSHGPASVPIAVPGSVARELVKEVAPLPHVTAPEGNTPTGPGGAFQLRPELILTTPREFVPPGVAGHDIPEFAHARIAAVGTAAGWAELSFCSPTGFRKLFRGKDDRIRLAPARTTVVPLPVISQARPRRGSNPV